MRCNITKQRITGAFFVCLCVAAAYSASAMDNMVGSLVNKQPVLLTADEVGYDSRNSTAVAQGHVEIVQGDTIVQADRVTYDQKTDKVHAIGHVVVVEPSGDVLFSNEATLVNGMDHGVVKQFKARLKDNSLFAAREADKVSKNVTKLRNVVYTPCNVCADTANESGGSPMWQMDAQRVTIDENDQKIRYQNVFMDVYGVPVLYAPYFSTPTPDAPSESGLLQPQYLHSTLLGSVVKEPVYLSIAPNMDLTVTPWYISGEYGPMLQGEFRYMSENSKFMANGAIIDAYNRDDSGNIIPGTAIRDYIDAHGNVQLNKYWDSGIDVERTSDDTFLTFYSIGFQDMMTSRLYAERIEDRNYFLIQSLAFQGLQPEDIASESPYILPEVSLHLESDPLSELAGSRITVDSNALVLERQTGDSDQRLSNTVGWKLPYVTHNGQVMELAASVRGDVYNVQDLTTQTGMLYSGTTGRVMPEIDFNWRYPFIDRFSGGHSLMLSPVVMLAASPDLYNNPNIPNDDSENAVFSSLNLFSPDKFAGLDEVESGFRGAYGVRGEFQYADEKYLEWLFGQAYQNNPQSPFPIAASADASFSDYVGYVGLRYKALDVGYAFRADRDGMELTSNQINGSLDVTPVHLTVSYIDVTDDPVFGDLKEVTGSSGVDITSTLRWNLSGSIDLGSNVTTTSTTIPQALLVPNLANPNPSTGTVGFGTGFLYHNECVNIIANIARSEITVQDVRPSTTYGIALVLKNFGSPDAMPNPASTVPGSQIVTGGVTATDVNTSPSIAVPANAPNPSQLFDNPTTPP